MNALKAWISRYQLASLVLLTVLLAVVLPLALDIFRLNLVGKYLTYAFVAIGLVMSSAFAALVVYAQEAVPGRVGMVSGVMFGLMFGISGVGAAGLGALADRHGIEWVYQAIAFLPLLGLATALLPATRSRARPGRCC